MLHLLKQRAFWVNLQETDMVWKGHVQENGPAMKNMFKLCPAGKLRRICSDDKYNHIFTKNGSMCSLSSGCMYGNDFRLRVATKCRVHLPHFASYHDCKRTYNLYCDPCIRGEVCTKYSVNKRFWTVKWFLKKVANIPEALCSWTKWNNSD